MYEFHLKPEYNYEYEDYPEDIDLITKNLLGLGYYASRQTVKRVWEIYSDSYCASWINPDGHSLEEFKNIFDNYCNNKEISP